MSLLTRIIIFSIIFLWFAGIFIEWLTSFSQTFAFAIPFLSKTYSLVCHQQLNKLICSDIFCSLVCARCVGIYAGFLSISFLSILAKNLVKPKLYVLITAAALMLGDVVFYSIGLYSYSKIIAFTTGLLLGSVGFFYFYSAFKQLIIELTRKKN